MILAVLSALFIGTIAGALVMGLFNARQYDRGWEDHAKTVARLKRETRRLFEQEAGR